VGAPLVLAILFAARSILRGEVLVALLADAGLRRRENSRPLDGVHCGKERRALRLVLLLHQRDVALWRVGRYADSTRVRRALPGLLFDDDALGLREHALRHVAVDKL